MRFSISNSALVLAALLGATACQSVKPTVAATPALPTPTVSAMVVRNSSAFDVNVYAVPTADATPIWLATVPAGATWQVPVSARVLQRDGDLVVRTQAIGATRSWTSAPITVDQSTFGLLDLAVSSSGDCRMSALRAVNAAEMTIIM